MKYSIFTWAPTIVKKTFSYIVVLTLSLICGTQSAKAADKEIVLIVSSYNPDTQRMSAFINDFETEISKSKSFYPILIESLNCKGLGESDLWKERFVRLLQNHKNNKIKAIIILGQEAFATYLSIEDIPKEIPFFTCFASENGLELPITKESASVNMTELAREKGLSGGILNRYDVAKNIDLILDIFPNTKNIAFISDNTYGGISLQTHVRSEAAKYPNIEFTFIDSRDTNYEEAAEIIGKLPKNSALLLGTWRVNKDGMFMLSNSINTLILKNKDIPVFTLTGTGMGTIAIGGYIPQYKPNGKEIADQIKKYYTTKNRKTVHFISDNGVYTFDKQQLDAYNIRESHLPDGSVIQDSQALIIAKYRSYVLLSLVVIVVLVLLMTWLYKTYRRNKALQKELIIAKNSAEESDKLKTAFLANMGHEIRTPLNAIVGFSTLLCEESFSEENKTEYCEIIQTNSDLLLTLINDILDISRMEAGKLTFYYNREDVASICDQIIMTTEHLHKRDITIQFVRPEQNIEIDTDIKRISQVLINLMTNAIKFTDSGNITLTYNIDRQKNMVIFSVTDTGCGIPKEQHAMVFSRFEKLNNCKQGTGLGLAISKQISTHFGGDIWIDSEYTSGCRFYFSHPINKSDPE